MIEPVLEALNIARGEFQRRLDAIGDGDWSRSTPCTEWDMRELVNHVIGQEFRFARNLAGGSAEEYVASRDQDFLGDHPSSAWSLGVQALDRSIGALASLDTTVAWRLELAARDVLGVRVFEATVHTWDISRAIGFDEVLDRRLVDFALDMFHKLSTSIPGFAALFAVPANPLGPTASAQDELLHLAGR